jgi:PleD family two-component response regulator
MRLLRRRTQNPPEAVEAEPLEDEAVPDPSEEAEPEPVEEPGPHLLNDGPVFARWFIIFELEREMRRASRHQRPLSVMVLKPVPTLGARAPEAAIHQAAEAARRASRATDLIGWLPSDSILVIMPETDRDGAAAAVYRWRNEMYTSTIRAGAIRWMVATNVDIGEFDSAEALLNALSETLAPAKAA